MLTDPVLNNAHNRLAWGLGKLANPNIHDDSTLMSSGHQMRVMLEWATEAEWTEEVSYLASNKLLGLGLIERAPERTGKHWLYRLTDEGRRFVGLRRHRQNEPLKLWVMLACGEREPIHFDLTNLVHLELMARMLAVGWSLPSRRQHGDTEEIPAVRDDV